MAEQGLLAIEPPAGDAGGGRMSRPAMILAVLAVTALAAGAGTATGFLMGGTQAPAASEPQAETVTQNPAVYANAGGPLTLVALTPVVTNISSPPATILRVEASLVVRAEEEADQTLLASQVSADTLAFVRTLDLAQIEGARGLLHLREDLRERAMLRSPAVADYVIHSLIAQ